MKVNKAYKFRMYPADEQAILLEKSFGTARFIYNYYLDKNKDKYAGCFSNINNLKELPKEYPWINEVDSCLLRTAVFDLNNSYQRFFKKLGEYPKYKSKYKSKLAYRTNNITGNYKGKVYSTIELDLKNKYIKLPKLNKIKIRGYRNKHSINGRIINATISKEANKYYVSVCVEEEIIIRINPIRRIIGIDMGIKNLVISSDGIKYENLKLIKKYENKIKGLNRWLARCQIGSKNRAKVKLKLQIVYKKLKNARKFYLHMIANHILKDNDLIACENLLIHNMVKNHNLAKSITDAAWYELKRILEYKTKWQGKHLVSIDTYYPSSQICSHCGNKSKVVKNLNIRTWECDKCHSVLNRDFNASENVMFEGLIKYLKEKKI